MRSSLYSKFKPIYIFQFTSTHIDLFPKILDFF